MIYVSVHDFYEKAAQCKHLTRQEELDCALLMKNGDAAARERIIQSYIPMVARFIKQTRQNLQTLGMVMYCLQALEKAVDSFDFMQDSETFARRLSVYLRQAAIKYIAR